jgi:transglutaminase-like putative cysteine protease
MSRKLAFLLAGLLPLLLFPVCAHADEAATRLPVTARDIDETLGTDWFGLYLKDKKIGYFKTSRERVGQGASAGVRDSFGLFMKLVSFGQKAELTTSHVLEFDAEPPYRLRAGDFLQSDGSVTQKFTLRRTDKGFSVTYLAGKEERTKRIGPVDYTLADAMTTEQWVRGGAKVGSTLAYREFDIQKQTIEISDGRVVSRKSSLAGGVPVTYFEIEVKARRDGLPLLSRLDQRGRLLSGQFALFEVRLESEEQAKNTEFSQDLFVLGMTKVDLPLGDTTQVHKLILKVTGKEAADLPSGPRQTVLVNPDATVTLQLGKEYGKPKRATAKEIEDSLAETTAYPIHEAKVKELARKAVGKARSPEEKVKKLVAFVHKFVRPSLSATLPDIHHLLEKKQGDCKSYALLFTTLARAAGIPSREVYGLMYVGDDQKTFGGHAWNEVVLDGHWVPIDASLGETEINATHISFGEDTRASANLLGTLGRLSFRVVEVHKK